MKCFLDCMMFPQVNIYSPVCSSHRHLLRAILNGQSTSRSGVVYPLTVMKAMKAAKAAEAPKKAMKRAMKAMKAK